MSFWTWLLTLYARQISLRQADLMWLWLLIFSFGWFKVVQYSFFFIFWFSMMLGLIFRTLSFTVFGTFFLFLMSEHLLSLRMIGMDRGTFSNFCSSFHSFEIAKFKVCNCDARWGWLYDAWKKLKWYANYFPFRRSINVYLAGYKSYNMFPRWSKNSFLSCLSCR